METLFHTISKQENDLEIDEDNIMDDDVLTTFLNKERQILKKLLNKISLKMKTGSGIAISEKDYLYDAVWDNING
jgi:hypothetical protein